MKNISVIRREYTGEDIEATSLPSDPIALFDLWFDAALRSGNPEPTAMTLATAGKNGQVSARMVLLKKYDRKGFYFFTNYQSDKGRQLDENPRAALVFYWPELNRQVRVEGGVVMTSQAESDQYFQARPAGSQLSAWASPQSRVIPGTETIHQLVEEYRARLNHAHVSRPVFWGGYILVPESMEFWQGKPDRLHHRVRYVREGESWRKEQLAP